MWPRMKDNKGKLDVLNAVSHNTVITGDILHTQYPYLKCEFYSNTSEQRNSKVIFQEKEAYVLRYIYKKRKTIYNVEQ
jgi:hypothetical protein